MNTTPINKSGNGNGKTKTWTRASIAAAVAAGALSAEGANLLYAQLSDAQKAEIDPSPNPNPNPNPTPDPDPTPIETPSTTNGGDVHPSVSTHHSASGHFSGLHHQGPVSQPTAQPGAMSPAQPEVPTPDVPGTQPIPNPTPEPEPVPTPDPTPDPTPEPEPGIIEIEPEPQPQPHPQPENVVDVIVEQIDPEDIDMEDILVIDEIGVLYTELGEEMNIALYHNPNGVQNMLVDLDGDKVYDVIATSEGDIVCEVPIDIDVSDVELLYAQQHGHSGYIQPNQQDIAMIEPNPGMQNDISLT